MSNVTQSQRHTWHQRRMCSGIAGPAGLAGMARWCMTLVWDERHFGQSTVRPDLSSGAGRGRGAGLVVGVLTGGPR